MSEVTQPRCPTCGSDLGGRGICPRCGTLVAVERAVSRMQTRTRDYVDQKLLAIPGRLTVRHFLWACAVMPVFLLPPICSLVMAIMAMRRPHDGPHDAPYEWIAIVSALNILLSALILYKFHFSPAELVAFFGGVIRSALRSLFDLVPLPSRTPAPRLIPA